MLCLFLHIDHLKIADIAKILGLKDNRSAKKWLRDNGISISVVGGKNVVDKFLFEFKRQQLLVGELRKSYPTNWFEIYDTKTEDKVMVQAIRKLYPKLDLVKKTSQKCLNTYIKL